jgi:hypothetical protein
MLKIRPEQLEVFQPVAEAAFLRRVVEHLREHNPDAVIQLPNEVALVKQISEEKLHAMARTGIARAREYGMDWESSVTAFFVVMVVTAPNFDKHPLIQRILKDENMETNARIDQLWERTTEENWEAVKKNYDPQAWESDPGGSDLGDR